MSGADKYDRAIALLTQRVNAGEERAILFTWDNPGSSSAGCLFEFTGRDLSGSPSHGCLTMVRSGSLDAPTPELTAAIRADDRIPARAREITLDHLPVFAEWQRRLDRELNR